MKRHLILAATISLCAICCSKHHDPPPIKEYFRGKVDGVFFSDSTTAQITIYRTGGRLAPPPVPFIGGQYTAGSITLSFPNWPAGERMLGAYGDRITITTSNGQLFFAGNKWDQQKGDVFQGSGKITILVETGSYMQGTFECIAPADSTVGIFPPISITEGEFKLKFQN